MKKFLLTTLAAVALAATAWGSPVSLDRAKATATTFFKKKIGRNATVKNVAATTDAYYVFNMSPQGWVIVSADDVAAPILGYNDTSSLNWFGLPAGMQDMLGSYSREISAIKQHPRRMVNHKWANLSTLSRAEDDDDNERVAPLINVLFNQGSPWNYYCPKNGSGQAIVGCVAVAMSQAMTVQEYPNRPKGKVSYSCADFGALSIDFDAEKEYDWAEIKKSSGNHREAARLLFHAGMSVHMGYGIEASGISSQAVNLISEGLIDHFGYGENDVRYIWRQQYTGSWDNLLLNELNAGRAVVYNAVDSKNSAGHSFNIDGYSGNKMFHVNWGWGGVGNGYFTLDNLADQQMNMNYDKGHVAVIGIGSPDRELRSIELSENVIDEKLPAGTVVALVTVNGEEPKSNYTLNLRGPYNPANGNYDEVPFKLEGNRIVTTASLTASEKPYEINIQVGIQGAKESLMSTFDITVCTLRTLGQATSMTYDRQSGDFLIKTRNGTSFTLTGDNGVTIASGNLSPVPHIKINRSQLTDGANTLTITSGSETKVIKIKK